LYCIYKEKTKQRSKKLFNLQIKILQRFGKTRICVMTENVLDFNTKEVEHFCSHLHFIYKGKTKLRSAILKTLEKFVQPANANFTTFCKKYAYEPWRKSFPTLVFKKWKAFGFICIVSIRGRLKSAQKNCSTCKSKFYIILERTRI